MTYSKTHCCREVLAILLIASFSIFDCYPAWSQGTAPVPGNPSSKKQTESNNAKYIAPVTQTSSVASPSPNPQKSEKPIPSSPHPVPESDAKANTISASPQAPETTTTSNKSQSGNSPIPGQSPPSGTQASTVNIDPNQIQNQQLPSLTHEMSKEEYKAKFAEWDRLQKKGAEAFRLCQYGVAERTLSKAVKKARQFGPGDVQFSKSSGELGRLLTVRGRFDEAEKLLQEELILIEMAVDRDKSKMIDKMGAMVTFYLSYGTKDKAFPMAEDLLDFVEGKIREQRSQKSRSVTLNKDGTLVGWAGTAKPEDRDPLLEWSIILDKLGYQFRVQGELDMADRLFKAALDIKATVLGKKHLSLANSYDSLGTVCLTRKDYKEAESYYQDALSITERILQPGNPKIYSRIDKLARCKIKEKKFSEARALYARARNEFGYNKGIQQQALYRLGCLYSDARNFSAAAPALRQALNLAIKNHGSQSIKLVPYLKKYAYVSYYLGNKGKNANLKARANNINPVVKALKPAVQMKAGAWKQPSK